MVIEAVGFFSLKITLGRCVGSKGGVLSFKNASDIFCRLPLPFVGVQLARGNWYNRQTAGCSWDRPWQPLVVDVGLDWITFNPQHFPFAF